MTWQALTEAELRDYLNEAEVRMNPEQHQFWDMIKITPEKWQQEPYGSRGGGFWAVAVIGRQVVWFNDIEEGFNVSAYKHYGIIGTYWCNQDQLEWTIQSLLNQMHGLAIVRRGEGHELT